MARYKETHPAVVELMGRVMAKAKARGESAADIARFIGKNYQWTYAVLHNRKGTPSTENVELIRSYLNLPDEPARLTA